MAALCRAEAPGKLVLLGEYAVVVGHPALVVAVDRRVRIELRPAEDHRIDAPALGLAGAPFRPDGDPFPGARVPGCELLAAVLAELAPELAAAPPFHLCLDSSRMTLTPGGPKLGLGSSAALATALVAALLEHCGVRPEPATLASRIRSAHDRAQGGLGSGVDLAAAFRGGVLRFRRDGDVEALEWPVGLHWAAVWSGRSASTPEMLAAVRQLPHETLGFHMEALGKLSSEGLGHFQRGEIAEFLGTVGAYRRAMGALGREAGVPIVSPPHATIADIVRRAGGAYKPSGAGGGDLGVLFSASPDSLHEALRLLARAGFPAVPLAVEGRGLHVRWLAGGGEEA